MIRKYLNKYSVPLYVNCNIIYVNSASSAVQNCKLDSPPWKFLNSQISIKVKLLLVDSD